MIPPRVVAHKRHARHGLVRRFKPVHLIRPRQLVGDRQRTNELHPFHVALTLAYAHKVVSTARRQIVRHRVCRPVCDCKNLFCPAKTETNKRIIRIVARGIVLRIQIRRKVILQIAHALIQRIVNRRHKLSRRAIRSIARRRRREIKRAPLWHELVQISPPVMELWVIHNNFLLFIHVVCHPCNLDLSLNTFLPNSLKGNIEISKATQHFSTFERIIVIFAVSFQTNCHWRVGSDNVVNGNQPHGISISFIMRRASNTKTYRTVIIQLRSHAEITRRPTICYIQSQFIKIICR